jgi:hypothetical protein
MYVRMYVYTHVYVCTLLGYVYLCTRPCLQASTCHKMSTKYSVPMLNAPVQIFIKYTKPEHTRFSMIRMHAFTQVDTYNVLVWNFSTCISTRMPMQSTHSFLLTVR